MESLDILKVITTSEVERIERQHGVHTIEAADELGFGTREYELINVD